ncbi:MAG: Transposase IS116/IS110/IS902 family protein [Pelotomaculum sp. PtaB.Bin013]|uniref:IS110 family transposase n=1 Tax=Pelotomaculum isophthalicicum JI TaxID=947010 RepID=A0A9X4H4K0_9FIRM|nr:IS110 family transposase [Pelotomaculum isophthalicicum]MDF9409856.1 IS110 family transposase [Pelotomaculum isophthalicicum JI]OPX91716.1 MAG: Transposase IS116/IS110/IS902 family protein [Pelotomaculum sp. PtaB.Bin013]
MLKIIHKICCGIDVHKKFVVATIGITNDAGTTEYQTKKFSTFTVDLLALRKWLAQHSCREVCMESTGKYWIPVFNILETKCNVVVANPKYVKGIQGKKTDKKDSVWICDLHKHGLVPNSFIPPLIIRQIRDLMRYRVKLTNFKSSEKNRIQNSLTVSNIMLSSVVSDTFGKSSMRIINRILKNPEDTDFDVVPMLHSSMKKNAEDIAKSINGNLTKPQAEKMAVCLSHLQSIDKLKLEIESAVLKLIEPYQEQISLILTLPGIKDIYTAIAIIGEIGVDMAVFKSSRHLCSWAGLTPQNNESAGKKKSVRVSRAGVYIKPLLVQCANAAIKSKDCPYFRVRYEQLRKRRGHKKAIIAIAHMLLNCIYHMLSKNKPFDYNLYRIETASRPKPLPKFTPEQAIFLLESLGAQIILPVGT